MLLPVIYCLCMDLEERGENCGGTGQYERLDVDMLRVDQVGCLTAGGFCYFERLWW